VPVCWIGLPGRFARIPFKHRAPCWRPHPPATDRGIVIVYPSRNDPPRWTASEGEARGRGLAPLDASSRALLRELRWRKPPRERWRPGTALVLVVLLHLLFVGAAWIGMQPSPHEEARARRDTALQVRLIARVPTTPRAAPPSLRAPPHRPSPAPAREPPARGAMTARVPGPPPAVPVTTAAPQLFDRTGQPLLPAGSGSAPTAPGYVARMPQGDTQVMQHDRPLPYQATRFERDFPRPDESLLGQGIRRAVNATHTNETRTVNLPGGVHLKCKTLLGVPTPFCHDPPPPPSRKDGDERLSMAPAAPLAKQLRQRDAPSLARCIALYRDGKPLPHGCPVDTPNRAVDAELADCIADYRAGRRQAAHCPANTGDLARRASRIAPAATVAPATSTPGDRGHR
jgi:hypothetical protein